MGFQKQKRGLRQHSKDSYFSIVAKKTVKVERERNRVKKERTKRERERNTKRREREREIKRDRRWRCGEIKRIKEIEFDSRERETLRRLKVNPT